MRRAAIRTKMRRPGDMPCPRPERGQAGHRRPRRRGGRRSHESMYSCNARSIAPGGARPSLTTPPTCFSDSLIVDRTSATSTFMTSLAVSSL